MKASWQHNIVHLYRACRDHQKCVYKLRYDVFFIKTLNVCVFSQGCQEESYSHALQGCNITTIRSVTKYQSFTVLYLTTINVWQRGESANESLANDGSNSICVYAMPAGRLPITMIEIMALTRFVICRHSVATGTGINRITVVVFQQLRNTVTDLSNCRVTCLHTSQFIFLPF